MNSSDLNRLFKGLINASTFKGLIRREVDNYERLMKMTGSRIPLVLHEDETISLDKDSVKKLLKETANGTINSIELAYVCDCLTLAEGITYANNEVKEIVFEIADPEVNGGYKSDYQILSLIEQISAAS